MEQVVNMTMREGIFAVLFVGTLYVVYNTAMKLREQMQLQIAEQWKCIEKQNDIIEKQTDQLNEQTKKIDHLTLAVRDLSDTVKTIVEQSR